VGSTRAEGTCMQPKYTLACTWSWLFFVPPQLHALIPPAHRPPSCPVSRATSLTMHAGTAAHPAPQGSYLTSLNQTAW
jgi:hypothetical protein